MSKTPEKVESLEDVVRAVNFYESLPDEVRRLTPETVAKCVAGVRDQQSVFKICWPLQSGISVQLVNAIAALEEEEKMGSIDAT